MITVDTSRFIPAGGGPPVKNPTAGYIGWLEKVRGTVTKVIDNPSTSYASLTSTQKQLLWAAGIGLFLYLVFRSDK
jgi:hypothetical protein